MQQNPSSFNLIDVVTVLKRRRNFITFFVLAVLGITLVLLFFVLPPYYKSTAVIVAANPVLADKGRLFNDNVEGLYSDFGSEDDLNRLYGIANLDTTYKQLVKKFNLVQYYKISRNNIAINEQKAVEELKKAIDLIRTDLYHLKISVSTKDKYLSAAIANEMVEIIHGTIRDLWSKSYEAILDKLELSSAGLERKYKSLIDSSREINNELRQVKTQAILEQLQQNEKIANQYKVAVANRAPALIVLEKAYPPAKADKPKKLIIIFGALLSSLAFSILLVLVVERKQL